jgi:hypothetical protein
MIARTKRTARKTTGGFTANLPHHRTVPSPVPNTQRDPNGPGLITNSGIQANSSDPVPIPRVILVAKPGHVLPTRRKRTPEPAPEPVSEPESVAEAEDESEPKPEPEAPPVKKGRYKTPRSYPNRPKAFKSDGGISYTKPQSKTGNAGSWTISYRCFRKSGFPTREAAAAKLKQWKEANLCPFCERTLPV